MTHLKTVHLYTQRHYGNETYKLLCSKEYFKETEFSRKGPWGRSYPSSVTTLPHRVTCPKCLETLIPKLEKDLATMKEAYERRSLYI